MGLHAHNYLSPCRLTSSKTLVTPNEAHSQSVHCLSLTQLPKGHVGGHPQGLLSHALLLSQ